MFNPIHKTIEYHNNPLTGRFEKQPSLIAFNKLPFDLKVEPTQKEFLISQGAENIITGRFKGGVREFFTGLIPIDKNCFQGNHYESIKEVKKLSLIIFVFSQDHKTLVVYFFNHFYIQNRDERMKFCIHFINHVTTK